MKKNQYFEDLKEGLTAAIDHEGGRLDLRTTILEIPELPPNLSKKKIKSIREEILGMSQPLFAQFLGVSAAAVKSWEQGNKKPSGTARRLMQLVEGNPGILDSLSRSKLAKAARR